jgi:DNA-binding MarR family transcriptional regulator
MLQYGMARRRNTAADAPRVDPASLDLGYLALFVGHAVNEAVLASLAARGHGDLRTSHGFVFQHLVAGARTIGELAERLAVSQQAASKAVAELERLGYVERTADAGDARVRRIALSARGRAAIGAGRKARAALERRLEARCGAAAVAAARRTLAAALTELGGAEAVRGRRVIAPR